jgi:hypothetical protein
MAERPAEVFVGALTVYAALGFLFAIAFVCVALGKALTPKCASAPLRSFRIPRQDGANHQRGRG